MSVVHNHDSKAHPQEEDEGLVKGSTCDDCREKREDIKVGDARAEIGG